MQFLRSYHVQQATWPWASLKVQKVTKVSIELLQEFYMKNILVKLQHNAGKFWGGIKFTRQLDLELYWKFKKIA